MKSWNGNEKKRKGTKGKETKKVQKAVKKGYKKKRI